MSDQIYKKRVGRDYVPDHEHEIQVPLRFYHEVVRIPESIFAETSGATYQIIVANRTKQEASTYLEETGFTAEFALWYVNAVITRGRDLVLLLPNEQQATITTVNEEKAERKFRAMHYYFFGVLVIVAGGAIAYNSGERRGSFFICVIGSGLIY